MIFQPIVPTSNQQPYLIYAQKFDCPHAETGPNPNDGLYRLKYARAEHGVRLGAVIPSSHIRCAADVAPFFGEAIDKRLTCKNSMEASTTFNLNTFSDKETYHLLRQ